MAMERVMKLSGLCYIFGGEVILKSPPKLLNLGELKKNPELSIFVGVGRNVERLDMLTLP